MADDDRPAPNLTPASRDERMVAVAIKGERPRDGGGTALPTVIASGRGALADQILQLAFERGIKVRQDADLAELLAKLDLDTPIPAEAIIAVAEILARVYQANARLANPAALTDGLLPIHSPLTS